MTVHAHRQRGLNILGKGVGRHGDDRHFAAVRPLHGADRPGGVVTVHLRHLNIHQYDIVVSFGAVTEGIHGFVAVGDPFHQKTRHCQDLLGDLGVEIVIFHKQRPPSGKVQHPEGEQGRIRRRVIGFRAFEEPIKNFGQPRTEQRLADEPVDSRGAGVLFDIAPVVGGDNDDGNFIAHGLADPAGGFNAVHALHFPVDNRGEIVIIPLMMVDDLLNRFLPGGDAFGVHPQIAEDPAAGFQAEGVVIGDQNGKSDKFFIVRRFRFL